MNKQQRRKLTDRFVFAVEQLNRQMSGGHWVKLRTMNLNVHQVNTLLVLNHYGPLCMSAIAGLLGSTQSHTTNVVRKLVGKKYMKRKSDPNDRRIVIGEITDLGKQAANRYQDIIRQRATMVSERWDVEQLESVVSSLELLGRGDGDSQFKPDPGQSG
ncbi:MAG: MarR family transcriptional regulator [Gemmatimonadetes bacterium]|nr:MarR family transcriptional regulator [Gemmatimonadota bacterium]